MEEQIQNQEPAMQSVVAQPPEDDHHAKSRVVRLIVAFVIITILAVVGLVFQEQIVSLFSSVDEGENTLTIAYAEGFTSIDPANYEVRNRQYLGNVFEGLTRFDKNLGLEPALAISWGQVENDVWEFKLREDVYFHDGSVLSADDVVSSIEYALDSEESQMKSLLSGIENVQATSDLTVTITTDGVDLLLPNRLAHVYIFPVEAFDYENLLVGTGPYYAVSFGTFDEGAVDQELSLMEFSYYWGPLPEYEGVNLVAISDKDDRQDAVLNGEVDVLVNVAPDSVLVLEEAGFEVVTQPGLEVSFLVFNTFGLFEEVELREAFAMAIDRQAFVDELGGYAVLADQFVGNGVNGFDSLIEIPAYNTDEADMIFEKYEIDKFQVYMTWDMVALGAFLEEQFLKIGVDVDAVYLTSEELVSQIGDLDVYFMGWKSDLGDSADLFETLFYSDGAYNGGYENSEVDGLISEAKDEDNAIERLKILKEIMSILIDDVAGVPLFEAKTIYGFADGITWSPRVDGYVWAVGLKIRD